MKGKDFEGTDVLSLYDWSKEKMEYVFKVSEKMEPIVLNRTRSMLLADKVLAAVFYLPSTRTRTSFLSAMERLGGSVIGWESAASSRARGTDAAKLAAETDKDTALMLESYADAIVLRHDHEGAAKTFAKWANVPVLNGGDGYGPTSEHPTQALLDLYTIKKEQGKIDGLTFLHLGNNHHARGGHSINYGLSKYDDVKVYICCSPETRLVPEEEKPLKELGLDYEQVEDLQDVISEVDVIQSGGAAGDESYSTW